MTDSPPAASGARRWLIPLGVAGLLAVAFVITVAVWPNDPGRVNTHGDPATRTDQEETFLYLVREFDPALTSRPDKVLLDGGHGFCDLLDRGGDAAQLYRENVANGGDPDAAHAIISAATTELCPEHPGLVEVTR